MFFTFSKIRDVKSPARANPSDAGIDFFPPNDFTPVTVPPQGRVAIQSGIRVNIPHGYMLQFCNKSGVATKRGLVYAAHIVDAGYEGELVITLINTSDVAVSIHEGEKIIQGVIVPVIHAQMLEVADDKLFENHHVKLLVHKSPLEM